MDDEAAFGFQGLLDRTVRSLDVQAFEVRNLIGEVTLVIEWAGRHFVWLQHSVGNGDAVIILAESGGLVNNTSTVGIADIRVDQDLKGFVLEL